MSVPIQNLSAYDLYQVQQSLGKYQASQQPKKNSGAGKDGRSYGGGNAWSMPVGFGGGGNPRLEFQRASYGIEDEYRYMQSQGFKGSGQAAAAAPPPGASGPAAPGQSGVQRDWTRPSPASRGFDGSQAYGNGVQQQIPQPVINFETPYQPVVQNRQSAVNNKSLKINSNYTKPKNKGGTSGFKRSTSERKFNQSNAAMRLNQSLSI